jgi:transcriptional regulator with PAS, ATPase and Fis domain
MSKDNLTDGALLAGGTGPGMSRAGLIAVLDGLPVGAALLDFQGRVEFLNRQLEALTGFTRAEAWGVPFRHVLRSSVAGREPGPGEGPRSAEGDIVNRRREKIAVRITSVRVRDGGADHHLEVVEDLSLVRELEARLDHGAADGRIVARSGQMERIVQLLPALSQSDSPVLVTGETGTGKDLIAEAIHKDSSRSREPFIRVSCSAMPEQILEAELFGHRKGAFSWAGEDRPGKFQLAAGGTLYLAEIADLPVGLQARLVRFLDERVIFPVGQAGPSGSPGSEGIKVDVRLVAATHRSPEDMVARGELRQDLFHRLSAVRLHLPPLRERGEDIEFLLDHFLRQFAAKLKKDIKSFSPKALRVLHGYAYPGNVREIRNIVEYAVMVCQRDVVLPAHLPVHLLMGDRKGGDGRKGVPARGAKR